MQYVPGIDLNTLSIGSGSFMQSLPKSDVPIAGSPGNANLSPPPIVSGTEAPENQPTQDEIFAEMSAQFGKMHIANAIKGRFFGPSSSYKYFTVSFPSIDILLWPI